MLRVQKLACLAVGLLMTTVVATPMAAGAPAYGSASIGPAEMVLDREFLTNVRAAGRSVFLSARLVQDEDLTEPSSLDARQWITVSAALLNVGPRASVFILRHVGAVRVVTGTDRPQTTSTSVDRPAGEVAAQQAAQSGAGLMALEWTERIGVNYTVMGRGDVSMSQVQAIASALKEDHSQPSVSALAAIDQAGTTVPSMSGIEPAGVGDGFVAGAGVITDDLNDEATLRDGGSYWRSNYTALWQMILYSDLASVGAGEVDCEFGSRTAAFTREWQSAEGLSQTSQLDAGTRDRADSPIWIERTLGDGSDYAWRPGFFAYIYIHRHGPNLTPAYRWDVRSIFNDADWHGAAYTYANYLFC